MPTISRKPKKRDLVWIRCKVRPGPFPNERRIYVQLGSSEWFGFVDQSELERKVPEGEDRVRATVIAVQPGKVVLGIRGQSPASGPIQTEPSLIAEYGAVPT
jgi:hypothetical protein